jgi:hypothetical protein
MRMSRESNMNRSKHSNRRRSPALLSVILRFVLLAAMATLPVVVRAQDALGPFISTVGTTIREAGSGRDWAYLL